MLLSDFSVLLLSQFELTKFVIFLHQLGLSQLQIDFFLSKLADLSVMPRLHSVLELEKVEHLLEHELPLQWVVLWIQDQAEMERQVLIDLG